MKPRFALVGLAILLLGATGAEIETPPPTLADPLPFDHAEHAEPFRREGVACIDCHPVGATAKEGPPVTSASTPAPLSTCHGCHRRVVRGAPRASPSACTTCHTVRQELMPESHDAFWLDEHGAAARGLVTTCADCHDNSQCVACHEARGALTRTPHGPAFRSAHGVEARMDPASCSTCHAGETCTSCHTTGGIPL